jgi:broad specificity phosphatase PhoE
MNGTPLNVTNENILAQFIGDQGSDCLIIARHGETQWNAQGRLQGQQDTALNKRGESQALAGAQFLRNIPLVQVHCSTLQRCRNTAVPIAKVNIGRPEIIYSDLLKEIALGVLEGELKDRQSTAELTRHYQNFSKDEIHYRIPDGENLEDVSSRVQRFFAGQSQLLEDHGIHLIVGHRNVNKMILKYLLGLSFEEGFLVEHENHRLYFYFRSSRELWSCRLGNTTVGFEKGYATTVASSYA